MKTKQKLWLVILHDQPPVFQGVIVICSWATGAYRYFFIFVLWIS